MADRKRCINFHSVALRWVLSSSQQRQESDTFKTEHPLTKGTKDNALRDEFCDQGVGKQVKLHKD